MTKKKVEIPKEVMGMKIPKSVRKSSVISSLLASKAGRKVAAAALTAAAGVLMAERKDVANAAEKGAKKTAKGAGIVGEAMEAAFRAAMVELNLLPKSKNKDRKDDPRRSYEGAPVH